MNNVEEIRALLARVKANPASVDAAKAAGDIVQQLRLLIPEGASQCPGDQLRGVLDLIERVLVLVEAILSLRDADEIHDRIQSIECRLDTLQPRVH
ncbi:MAG TPA: hypothetical protein PLN91_00575 [Rhodanobacteraceae bacterium]|nr:hypothetical protein [Rhodanobacteraceae bacterium]